MAQEHHTDPDKLPTLGRLLLWVDRPGSANKLFWGLGGACVLLFLLDFTYSKHPHFEMEKIPGAYGIYGFVCFTFIVLAAKAWREVIKRPEDYYGDKAIDREDYPEDQIDKVNHDGL